MAIKTNHLESTINYSHLDATYDFFKVSTSDKYIKSGAKVLDTISSEALILSILFIKGNCFFVMMSKGINNKQFLKEALLKTEEGQYLSIISVQSNELEKDIVLQLLFNGLCNSNNPVLSFCNLTGHIYCFNPSWIKHRRTNGQDEIVKVPCLEIRIINENLNLNVRTFSSTILRKKITFRKKKFEEYPRYSFATKNMLKRIFEIDNSPSFILRQTDGDKTDIPFLNIQNHEKFSQSKMGVLATVIEFFNAIYSGLVHIEFSSIKEYKRIDHKRKDEKEFSRIVTSKLGQYKIKIVDQISDEYSKLFCEKVADIFNNKFGIMPLIGTRMTKTGLNIVLIHNAAYYEDNDDPHDRVVSGNVVQHITFEDFADCAEYAVSTIVNELLVKDDLRTGTISLFNWTGLRFESNFLFGTSIIIDDVEKYFFMTIHPDGSFHIRECELDLFSLDKYQKYAQIYDEAKNDNELVRGIICDDKGNTNIIYDTACYTIPEIDEIKKELIAGNTKIRGELLRKQLMDAILDIKWYKEGSIIRYFSSDIGEGMRPTVHHAANIREIRALGGSELLFEAIAPLLNVTFVRNGQLTVIPFPFKYLKEYIIQSYKIDV